MNFTGYLFLTLLSLLIAGDALEFPRKGYRFPLKRNVEGPSAAPSSGEGSPEDLVPMAQSYFITPEAPTTTTIKPTFKRRSTNQPISATWGGDEKKKKDQPIPSEIDSSTNSNANNRQGLDTGFQPKKSFSNKKRRPSSSSIDMMRRDQNANEGGVVGSSPNESTSNNGKEETGNGIGNKMFGGRRKPKKMLDYAGISPSSSSTFAKIPAPRPSRFGGHRRNPPVAADTPTVANGEEVSGSTTESSIATSAKPARGSFSRSGRQFGRGPRAERVEPVEIQPQLAVTENQPLRRRKKFTSTTSSSKPNLGLNANNDSTVEGIPPVQDPELQKINANVFASRRPFSPINRFATPPTPINLIDNAQVQQDNAPLNRRMQRHRPAPKTLLVPAPAPLDSEHQSSDTITILAESSDSQQDEAAADQPSLPVSRNLSNRKPNPLDKLNNRQAAARRFLTPKKVTEEGDATPSAGPTTKAPPVQTTPRAARKSPLSLANLRNRRIGGSSSTTTTTETPIVSDADPQSHEVLGNLEALTGDGAVVNGSDSKKDTSDTGAVVVEGGDDSPKKDDAGETPVEEEPKSPLAGLLRNRRPPLRRPLPGARSGGQGSSPSVSIPIKPRGPLKPKPTQATTEAPLNVETTTQPTCEDGKRYNKILRKCIPGFKSG